MKHALISLFLMTAVSAFSAILTPEEALQRVFADRESPRQTSGQKEISLLKTLNSVSGQPTLYLFKEGSDSWMVVSASDATEALLGYGDSYTPADPMPPQMEWWLDEYSRQIAYSDSLATLYPELFSDQTFGDSDSPSKAKVKPIATLMKTKWNQSEPYDLFTPTVNGRKTPTGCVATALCQVMKYHNYPPAATGTGSATAGGEELTMDLNRPIDWDNMLNEYKEGEYTEEQAVAVADFMVLAAFGCKMQYAPGGSGAYNSDANRTLVENFSYAPSAWAYYRDHYSTQEWKDMLYEQLQNVGPVYYSGYGSGGHAFVCDGCNVLGFFHFNWGWGGSYNGYFKIDALNPGGQGIGGSAGGYNRNQVAIFDVKIPTGNEKMPPVRLSTFDGSTCRIIDNSTVSLRGGWYNYSYVDTDFTVSFELSDSADTEVWYAPSFQERVDSYFGYDTLEFDLSQIDCPDGTYTGRIVTHTEAYPEWLPVLKPYWDTNSIRLQKTGNLWEIKADSGDNGIESISDSSDSIEVYTASGIWVRRSTSRSGIGTLTPGIYILKKGSSATKIHVSL